MKCCKCGVEIDVTKPNEYPPPKWYGYYVQDMLRRLICAACIKKPENKDWWKDDKSNAGTAT